MMKFDIKQFSAVLFLAALATLASIYAPSPVREASVPIALLAVGAMRSFFGGGPPAPPAGPTILMSALAPFMLVAGVLGACSAAQNRQAVDAGLSVAQIACVFAQQATDSAVVATACGIVSDPALEALIKRLVSQREAAKRAGVSWEPLPVDAGHE